MELVKESFNFAKSFSFSTNNNQKKTKQQRYIRKYDLGFVCLFLPLGSESVLSPSALRMSARGLELETRNIAIR
jgi:hypothetical protein